VSELSWCNFFYRAVHIVVSTDFWVALNLNLDLVS